MEYKLYDSKEGYYSKSNDTLWESDYYTSPMIHSSFAYMLARYIYSSWILMRKPKNFYLIELGGGGLYLIKEIINSLSVISNDFLKQCNILIIDKNFKNILNIDHELNLVISDTFCLKNINGFIRYGNRDAEDGEYDKSIRTGMNLRPNSQWEIEFDVFTSRSFN